MAKQILSGISISAGISVGRAYFMNRSRFSQIPRQTVSPELVPFERERLELAFGLVRSDLRSARDRVPEALKEHASLIDTHLMISEDPKLLKEALRFIEEMGITAEWALEKAVDDIARAFAAIEDPYIRERIQDVRVVAERIQGRLLGESRDKAIKPINSRVVLMAHDLSPADTIDIDVSKIMSIVTAMGGKTSHTGILARSLQIPALVGVQGLEENVADGLLVIVDGLKGRILVEPDEDELAHYSDLKYQFENYHASILRECSFPGETIDGYSIQVHANIELSEEVTSVLDNGGEGIGLYRTEYSFMSRNDLPSEEELYEEYLQLLDIMAPAKVVFRTLDLGADKLAHFMEELEEPNPAMGLRAIRFCMRHEDLFRRQLRAILRASLYGNAALMFPMISGLQELRQAKAILAHVRRELTQEEIPFKRNLPLGIMIELPAAVMISEVLAQEVDFFSVGTNDLIQYTLGIDRANHNVSYLYQPLHPAVVRSIKHVVDAGHQAGIEVSVCGELASDPYCIPILMGMQVDSVSITPHAIPGIKRVIRQTTLEECKELLRVVLETTSVSKINRQVKRSIFKRFPEELTFYSSLLDMDETIPPGAA